MNWLFNRIYVGSMRDRCTKLYNFVIPMISYMCINHKLPFAELDCMWLDINYKSTKLASYKLIQVSNFVDIILFAVNVYANVSTSALVLRDASTLVSKLMLSGPDTRSLNPWILFIRFVCPFYLACFINISIIQAKQFCRTNNSHVNDYLYITFDCANKNIYVYAWDANKFKNIINSYIIRVYRHFISLLVRRY